MSLETLKKIIKENNRTNNVFLLSGEEAFMKRAYFGKLYDMLADTIMPDFNNFTFKGSAIDLSAVDEAIEALPVMAENKLIVFENSGFMSSKAKQEAKDYWQKRLKSIPSEVYLIFNEDEIDKRSGMFKAIKDKFLYTEFSYLSENEMINWTAALFKRMGKTIGAFDAKYLISITADGMLAVKQEAEKLCAYTQDKTEVKRQDIDRVVTPTVENKVFLMIEDMINKNIDGAVTKLNDLFVLKEDEHKILGAIVYNIDKLINTKILLKGGADRSRITSELKISPFQTGKFVRDADKFSLPELYKIINNCADISKKFNMNSIDNRILLELLVAENTY